MDSLDNEILQILFFNSRATNREIAEAIDLSVSAVHKRIKSLEEDGIITRYVARPSIAALGAIPIVIIGRSRGKSITQVLDKLGQHDAIFGVAVASGNVLYISGMLRNIAELGEVSTFATSTANFADPMVGIVQEPYPDIPSYLTDYEMRIIKSLNTNARKSISDVAEEIGSSTKTVKKNLDRMIDEGKVDFSIEWAPLYRESFVSVFHIKTKNEVDVKKEMKLLYERYRENIVICVVFANVPSFILLETWTQSPRESQEILEELQSDKYLDIIPHILMSIHWYPNWMDNLLQSSF